MILFCRYQVFKLINPTRNFHNSPFFAAKPSPKILKKKRYEERSRSVSFPVSKEANYEDSLPPMHLLLTAKKSGALSIEPKRAIEFLYQYQSHVSNPTQCWESRLISEYGITLETVTLLGAILRKCKSKSQQLLARSLLLLASSLGEKTATFEIISTALRTNVISSFKKSFVHLERLAEDGDQQAMMLLGKVFFHTKTEKDALPWLHKATHPPTGNLEFDGAGEALVIEGRILSKLGNISGAKALFEKAAKQLNDPEAYFYLSQMEENGSTSQNVYLQQAASMGVTEACHNLGVIELQKLQETSFPLTKVDDYGMALEWFLVAATDRFGPSVLNLANIYKMTGQMREAAEWLKIAEEIPGLSNQVRSLHQELDGTIAAPE